MSVAIYAQASVCRTLREPSAGMPSTEVVPFVASDFDCVALKSYADAKKDHDFQKMRLKFLKAERDKIDEMLFKQESKVWVASVVKIQALYMRKYVLQQFRERYEKHVNNIKAQDTLAVE